MARRLNKTLLDYLVIAINPALIIALVGSLVFFLLEVFYQGNFQLRLHYVFALFIIGAVLISRISIEDGRERAVLFAIPLAIVTLLAINKFVKFQGDVSASFSFLINLGLIGLIWWSADKLTWDCTVIDENEEDSGEGLLEAVGLDRPGKAALQKEIAPSTAQQEPSPSPGETAEPSDALPPAARTEGVSNQPVAANSPKRPKQKPAGWWQRFVKRRRRPHAPGVWIVYFSLAALPLFGIGQMFLPAGSLAARQYAFCLLCVYTASGLGLLLATSFLGLRRYLRQRRQEMPLMMVNLWLMTGGVLIAGVMLAAMFLPRPNAEYAVAQLPFRFGSPDQKASRHGVGREGGKEDRPDARGEQRPGEPPKSGSESQAGKSSERSGEKSSQSSRQTEPKDGSSRNPSPGKQGEQRAEKNSAGSGKDRSADDKRSTGRGSEQEKDTGQAKNASPAGNSSTSQQSGDQGRPNNAPRTPPMLHPTVPPLAPALSPLLLALRWLVYGVLALLMIFALWSNRDKLLAALQDLRQWLADFWHNLFGAGTSRGDADEEQAGSQKARLARFADFRDPFVDGTAGRYRPEELVRYTFEALEAWGRDHGHPRARADSPRVHPLPGRASFVVGGRRGAAGRTLLPGGLCPRHAADGPRRPAVALVAADAHGGRRRDDRGLVRVTFQEDRHSCLSLLDRQECLSS